MEKAVTPEFGLDPWNWVAGGTRYIEGSAFLSTTQLALCSTNIPWESRLGWLCLN